MDRIINIIYTELQETSKYTDVTLDKLYDTLSGIFINRFTSFTHENILQYLISGIEITVYDTVTKTLESLYSCPGFGLTFHKISEIWKAMDSSVANEEWNAYAEMVKDYDYVTWRFTGKFKKRIIDTFFHK